MSEHLPILIILCPFLAALTAPLTAFAGRQAPKILTAAINGAGLLLACISLASVARKGPVSYEMGNWAAPYGIEFYLDSINSVLLVMIFLMGLFSILFSIPFLQQKNRRKSFVYCSVLSLLICGLAGMTATGDVFNFYVFLEITSLAGYTLIAMGGDQGTLSAFRYLMIGTIGASFYLLGVAFLYGETGSLNMADIAYRLLPSETSGTTLIAMSFFVIGFGIKMALFPLHGWQPAAYTNAHPGAAPLIAGVMGKIPAYGMIRFFFFLFAGNSAYVRRFLLLVGLMSCAGMLYGSLKAMRQTDFRRLLAYSSIAQIGYVGMGIAIAGHYGLIGAVLHILGHSAMKSCLFFCAGGIRYRYGEVEMLRFGQLYRTMPLTAAAIVVAGLSMVGVPPLTGFFSKWYLAYGAAKEGIYLYVVVLVISSLLNAVYFFRLFERLFMDREAEDRSLQAPRQGKAELPVLMLLPILACALLIILLGICNTAVVDLLNSAIWGVSS
ncbi:MAG TPA: NADH/ubiquinone/plastoquinone (complex I) [Lachnospiraceae bacterium]|nr:NADH/ubiquinone/plastoquinone (complex I) [Lachnospiraceae bacterium]